MTSQTKFENLDIDSRINVLQHTDSDTLLNIFKAYPCLITTAKQNDIIKTIEWNSVKTIDIDFRLNIYDYKRNRYIRRKFLKGFISSFQVDRIHTRKHIGDGQYSTDDADNLNEKLRLYRNIVIKQTPMCVAIITDNSFVQLHTNKIDAVMQGLRWMSTTGLRYLYESVNIKITLDSMSTQEYDIIWNDMKLGNSKTKLLNFNFAGRVVKNINEFIHDPYLYGQNKQYYHGMIILRYRDPDSFITIFA